MGIEGMANPKFSSIPRRDLLEPETVRQILHLAGCPMDEIESFVAQNGVGC